MTESPKLGPSALHPIEASELHARRERVYLVLAGLFLGSMVMLNILGITRFLDLSFTVFGVTIPMPLAVGVLPYPITFLCTDFISELYGRKRANFLVWVGLILNIWLVLVLTVAGWMPGFVPLDSTTGMPPAPVWDAARGSFQDAGGWTFYQVRNLTLGAVIASMVAYLAAQLVDVHVFHFWKDLTRGKHLWLRNNGSTMVSQMVDTVAVILITHFYAHALPVAPDKPLWPQLMTFIISGYTFKFVCALLDTIPFYIGVPILARYLQIDPNAEYSEASAAEAAS